MRRVILCMVLFISSVAASHYFFPPASAIDNLIGIQLSQACIRMEENHVKSNCLTYDKLKQFDNGNLLLEGQWVNDTWYHRADSKVRNAYSYYTGTGTIVSVDPNSEFMTRAKNIIVQSDNFTYINPAEIVGANHTRTEYQNRFVSSCDNALVAPNISLINDTIKYLESNCVITNYNGTIKVKTPAFVWSYDNPYSTLHQYDFLKNIMHGHTTLNGNVTRGGLGPTDCIHHRCDYVDPYKKSGW